MLSMASIWKVKAQTSGGGGTNTFSVESSMFGVYEVVLDAIQNTSPIAVLHMDAFNVSQFNW